MLKVKAKAKAKNIKVLIVDDVKINQILLQKILNDIGIIDIQYAFNGLEAVEKYTNSDEVSLVFMDHDMPIMHGTDAIRRIREHEKKHECLSVPIVYITANTDERIKTMALDAGANMFLTKPSTSNKIIEAIHTYFELQSDGLYFRSLFDGTLINDDVFLPKRSNQIVAQRNSWDEVPKETKISRNKHCCVIL